MAGILNNINSPEDLRKLSVPELGKLSGEIRNYIIEVVSKRGGHLASSLGCVEITLALHYVFNSPRDQIVWDVGHQSYAHKIITGRRESFKKLRTMGGISGFPRIAESEHDIFGVGHASTSISAALGLAVARDIRGDDNYVISVVGDGAMSGGIAFEGINQSGHLKKDKFIIVLSDNEMSISKNVGALSKYLTMLTTENLYLQLEADVWELLGKVPSLGGKARKLASRVKEGIKNLVVPSILFEELGFRYYGPLNGHDISQLVEAMKKLKKVPGPILVHTITKKGKGYKFAERDSEKFHGVGGFYKTTGNSRVSSKNPKYSKIFGGELTRLAGEDDKIIAITAAMTEGTGLSEFAAEIPDRFFDVGIAEQHAVTFAAGLAREGMKPFVCIYSTFLQRGYDQVIHDVALQKLPVRFILDRAGLVGRDGPTHHGAFDISYMRIVPNMVIMAPRDEIEMIRMVRTARAYDSGPIAMRFPRGNVKGIETDNELTPVEIGKGEVLQKGNDITLIGIGSMVDLAVESAGALADIGMKATVIDARFAKPLDRELILSNVDEDTPVITMEENSLSGGFGESVSQILEENGRMGKIIKVGIPDRFIQHGNREELHRESGLTVEAVIDSVKRELTG